MGHARAPDTPRRAEIGASRVDADPLGVLHRSGEPRGSAATPGVRLRDGATTARGAISVRIVQVMSHQVMSHSREGVRHMFNDVMVEEETTEEVSAIDFGC